MKIEKIGHGVRNIGQFIKDQPFVFIAIVVIVVLGILAFRARQDEPVLEQVQHPMLDYGHLFEQIKLKQEALGIKQKKILDMLKMEEMQRVGDRRGVIWYEHDPEAYKQVILGAPRPGRVRDGYVRVAAGHYEPVQDVLRRQRERFERALARGDYMWADIVRRETELALGKRLEW